MKTQNYLIRNLLFIALFLIAFLERTVWDLGPNIELVTAGTILIAYFLGQKESLSFVLLVMILSDLILGNTKIFLFTWSGFLIPTLFISQIIKKHLIKIKNLPIKITSLTAGGLLVNLFFFFWTNLGVWVLDSWGMYSKDLSGLITCYINGLPFLKNQILSNLIFIPLGFFVINSSINFLQKIISQKAKRPVYLKAND